jgi:hypothetical protein
MPAGRFVAQVGLRLPRQQKAAVWPRTVKTGWQAVPLVLFAAWVFVQALFIVVGMLVAGLSGPQIVGQYAKRAQSLDYWPELGQQHDSRYRLAVLSWLALVDRPPASWASLDGMSDEQQ